MNTNDYQVGGTHYTSLQQQPFALIKKTSANFWVGNVIKYVTRHRQKNGLEDLQKAMHYLEWIEQNHPFQPLVQGSAQMIGEYCSANDMTRLENKILWYAISSQIYLAKISLEQLMQEYDHH